MRTRNNPHAKEELLAEARFIPNQEKLQEILAKKENCKKKIYLEIGMGKGDFLSQLAFLNPDCLYIGVEISMSVLATAIKKIKGYEKEKNTTLENLYVMSFDAILLKEYFREGQIEKIYLNFSDPWPKKRHIKRRLTYKDFLEKYQYVLKQQGGIEFKTDNRILFEFSLVSMQNFGMKFLDVYLDLHQTDIFNIETEYETKFSKKGPIYKLVAEFQ